ncbi:DM13 domain-containing protein [Colwelliaceae bacterium BS250]
MLKISLALCISTLLFGCGGSGGDSSSEPDSSPTAVAPQEFTGQFIDSPVEGLSYSTATQSGITNAEGEFIYLQSEQVTFSIGDLALPAVMAQSVVTPLNIFSSEDVYQKEVSNLLRLLQSLDNDGNPDNGILINDQTQQVFNQVDLVFTDDDFAEKANALLMLTTNIHQSLISEYDAIYHFDQSLVKIDDGQFNNCGSDHSMVGYSASFATFAHDVSGTATIIDNCTITITDFNYDGGGPDVYIYAAINHQYGSDAAFQISDQINGKVFTNETLTLTLPNGKTLNDLTGLSVWCVDFQADFGNLDFMP